MNKEIALATLIWKARNNKNLYIYQLSHETGVSQHTIKKCENGLNLSTFFKIIKLLKHLEVPPEEIYNLID